MRKNDIFHIIVCIIVIIFSIWFFITYINGSDSDFEAQKIQTYILIASTAGVIYISRYITISLEKSNKNKRKEKNENRY